MRESELRRAWNAPKLRLVASLVVPCGWGEEEQWEKRLIMRLKCAGTLQLFAGGEKGRELADCTKAETKAELRAMCRETEVDTDRNADELPNDKVDWRFCNEFLPYKFGIENDRSLRQWNNLLKRQIFLNWLRGNEWADMPERLLNAQREGETVSQ